MLSGRPCRYERERIRQRERANNGVPCGARDYVGVEDGSLVWIRKKLHLFGYICFEKRCGSWTDDDGMTMDIVCFFEGVYGCREGR